MTTQKPSIGRIVHYTEARFTPVGEPFTFPAIIVQVHEGGAVDLGVFAGHGYYVKPSAPQGDGPGFWKWPPRAAP